jgi:hypothetical protein
MIKVERKTIMKPRVPAGPLQVVVGFPRGKASNFVISKAIWNEFGTRRIPERPFFRNAMRKNRKKYVSLMAARAKQIVEQKETVSRAINQLGVMAVGDVQYEIVALRHPPNAPSTIKAKGSSNPLIDTGEMRQSVTYQVRGSL